MHTVYTMNVLITFYTDGWDFLLFYYNVDELSLADELSLSDLTKNYQVKL